MARGGLTRRPKIGRWPALTASLAIAVAPAVAAASDGVPTEQAAQRPNIVVVMVDDMPAHMLWVLDRTTAAMADGTRFTNAVVEFALCCPSRASFLTGQYSHNHGITSNSSGWTRFVQSDRFDDHVGTWLQHAGYRTALIGRTLNGYGVTDPAQVPPGWDHWAGLVGWSAFRYDDYTLNIDGSLERERVAQGGEYQTDRLARLAVDWIEDAAAVPQAPFFLWLTPLAPHLQPNVGVPVPSSAYRHAHDGATWRPSNFGSAGSEWRPPSERRGRFSTATAKDIDARYEGALEALESVDDLMVGLLEALDRTGLRDDTVVVFTSDHGFFNGENGFAQGKSAPYESALSVPLLVSGPGFDAVTDDRLTVNVDLTATIVQLADAQPSVDLDGVALGSLFEDRAVPIAGTGVGGRVYRGVRSDHEVWWTFQEGRLDAEWYDLAVDPWQLRNLTTARPTRWRLSADRQALTVTASDCAGSSCQLSWPG